MKRIFFTSIGIFLFSISLFAQKEETVFGYSGLRLTGMWGGPSSGTSFYGDSYAFHKGGFFGLEFNNAVFLGWGWYRVEDQIGFPVVPVQNFDLRYNGFILGVSAMPNKVVHPRFSLLTGSGLYNIQFEGRNRAFILQPSAGFEVNIFRWWHMSVEGGYRMAATRNRYPLYFRC